MSKIMVKVISNHQPNEIIEMDEDKALQLFKTGQVVLLNGENRDVNRSEEHTESNTNIKQPIKEKRRLNK